MFRRKSSLSNSQSEGERSPTSAFSFLSRKSSIDSKSLSRKSSMDGKSAYSDTGSAASDSKSTTGSLRGKTFDLALATGHDVLLPPTKPSRAAIATALLNHSPDFKATVEKKVAKINKLDKENKKGPLHYASLFGTIDELQAILAVGHASININLADGIQRTALHYAVIAKRLDVEDILLRQEGINVNLSDKFGYTALHYAIANDDPESTQSLLSHEPDLDHVMAGETYLHFATRIGKANAALALISHPFPNVNCVDISGDRTPLHFACELQLQDVVQALIEHGADPTRVDKMGKLPIDYLSNHEDLREYLTLKTLSVEASRRIVKKSMFAEDPPAKPSLVTQQKASVQESTTVEQAEAFEDISERAKPATSAIARESVVRVEAVKSAKPEFNYSGLLDDISDDSLNGSRAVLDTTESFAAADEKEPSSSDIVEELLDEPQLDAPAPGLTDDRSPESNPHTHETRKKAESPPAQLSVLDCSDDNAATSVAESSSDSSNILSILDDLPSELNTSNRSEGEASASKDPRPDPTTSKVPHSEPSNGVDVPETSGHASTASRSSSAGSLISSAFGGAAKVISGIFATTPSPSTPVAFSTTPPALFSTAETSISAGDGERAEYPTRPASSPDAPSPALPIEGGSASDKDESGGYSDESFEMDIEDLLSEADGPSKSNKQPVSTTGLEIPVPSEDEAVMEEMPESGSVVIHDPDADTPVISPAPSPRPLPFSLQTEPLFTSQQSPSTGSVVLVSSILKPDPTSSPSPAPADSIASAGSNDSKTRRVSFSSPIASRLMFEPNDPGSTVAEEGQDDASEHATESDMATSDTSISQPCSPSLRSPLTPMILAPLARPSSSRPPSQEVPPSTVANLEVNTAVRSSNAITASSGPDKGPSRSSTVSSDLAREVETSSSVGESCCDEDEVDGFSFIPPPPPEPHPAELLAKAAIQAASIPLPPTPAKPTSESPLKSVDMNSSSSVLFAAHFPSQEPPRPVLSVVTCATPPTSLQPTMLQPFSTSTTGSTDSAAIMSPREVQLSEQVEQLSARMRELEQAASARPPPSPLTGSPVKLRLDLEDAQAQLSTEKARARRLQEEVERLNSRLKEKNSLLGECEIKLQRMKLDRDHYARKCEEAAEELEIRLHQEQQQRRQLERELNDLQQTYRDEMTAMREVLRSTQATLEAKSQQLSVMSEANSEVQQQQQSPTRAQSRRQQQADDEDDSTSLAASPGPLSALDGPTSTVAQALDMLAMSHKLSEQASEAAVLRKKLEESQSERASREKSLDQELKLTKQKLDVANQQIQALTSQLKTLEGLEQKARSRIVEYEKEASDARDSVTALDRHLGSAKDAARRAQEDLQQLNAENVTMRAKLESMHKLNSELQVIRDERDSLVAEASRLKSQLQQQSNQAKVDLQALANSHSVSVSAQTAKFKADMSAMTDQLATMTLEQQRLSKLNVQLSNDKAELEARTMHMSKSLDRTAAELASLREDIAASEKGNSSMGELVGRLRAEKAGLQSSLDEKTEVFTKLERVCAQLRADESAARETATSLQAEVMPLRTECHKLKAAVAERETALMAMTGQVDKLRADLLAIQNKAHSQQLEADQAKRSGEGLSAELASLRFERDQLSSTIRDLRRSRDEAIDDSERAVVKLQKLDMANKELRQTVASQVARISQLETQLESVKVQYDTVKKTHGQLQLDYEGAVAERDSASKKVAQLREQVLSMESQSATESKGLLEQLRGRISQLESSLSAAEDGKQGLCRDLDRELASATHLRQQLDATATSNKALESDLAKLKSSMADTQSQLHQAQLTIKALQQDLHAAHDAARRSRDEALLARHKADQEVEAIRSQSPHLEGTRMHSEATSKALLQDAQDRYRDALVTIAKLESQLESLTLRLALKADLASEANSRESELKETVAMLRHQLKEAEELILVERTQAMDKVKTVIAELERENLGSMAKHVQNMIERSTKGVLDELQNRVAQVVAGQQRAFPTAGASAPATPGVSNATGRVDGGAASGHGNQQNTPIHVHVHHNGHTTVEEDGTAAAAVGNVHAAPTGARRNPPARSYKSSHRDSRDAQNHSAQQEMAGKIAYLEEKLRLLTENQAAVASSMRSIPPLAPSPRAHYVPTSNDGSIVVSGGYAVPVSSHRLVRLASPKKPAPRALDGSAGRGNIRDTIAKLKEQNVALVGKLDSLARRNELYGVAHRR